MIVVNGRVRIPAERSQEFGAIAMQMCEASRADDGCIGYRVYKELERPDHYVFIEEWRDEPALLAHFGQPHTARFMGALLPMLAEPADALFHTVETTRRLEPGVGLVPAG